MALSNGHQGIQETAYGTYRFNKQTKQPELVDVMRFPAECVNPPQRRQCRRLDQGRHEGREVLILRVRRQMTTESFLAPLMRVKI